MTLGAGILYEWFMPALRILVSFQNRLMATGAEQVLVFDQHSANIARMDFVALQACTVAERVVGRRICFNIHGLRMTVNAKLFRFVLEELGLSGCMPLVAGSTVILFQRLVNVGLFEVRFQLDMAAVAEQIHAVLED